MLWPDDFVREQDGLLHAANDHALLTVQERLGVTLPSEVIAFLRLADGGHVSEKRFIIYSAGKGIHPSETLLAANERHEADFPLILLGRDAQEEFGVKKTDLPAESCPIYFWRHEEETLERAADSFREFTESMCQN